MDIKDKHIYAVRYPLCGRHTIYYTRVTLTVTLRQSWFLTNAAVCLRWMVRDFARHLGKWERRLLTPGLALSPH